MAQHTNPKTTEAAITVKAAAAKLGKEGGKEGRTSKGISTKCVSAVGNRSEGGKGETSPQGEVNRPHGSGRKAQAGRREEVTPLKGAIHVR
jgi:hypothetical protein